MSSQEKGPKNKSGPPTCEPSAEAGAKAVGVWESSGGEGELSWGSVLAH